MKNKLSSPEIQNILHELKHLLPSQGPLKDFIHHNTLHAFQHLPFHKGLEQASKLLNGKTYLKIDEYIKFYEKGEIDPEILDICIQKAWPNVDLKKQKIQIFNKQLSIPTYFNTSLLRSLWKTQFQIDLDGKIHSSLFRILCSFLDQGISSWRFPNQKDSFLDAIRKLDKDSWFSIFSYGSPRARNFLHDENTKIEDVLSLIVGSKELYSHYIFDQQFSHPGWSGLINYLEEYPDSLISQRKISLYDLILFESLMELDYLDFALGIHRPALGEFYKGPTLNDLLSQSSHEEVFQILSCWQEAFEKTYYNSFLFTLQNSPTKSSPDCPYFQAVFCIDDRESSFRTYLEKQNEKIETFGTPGFFGVEFYYQPENSFHTTKLCPAPVTPKYLIKQSGTSLRHKKDMHLDKASHTFVGGWLISQTLGFWSALQLFIQIFRPSLTPATATSLRHMDKISTLTVENEHTHHHEHGLQIGFTVPEMTERVYNMLMSIGLNKNFADLVYLISHGSSSNNNPHYAAYDCGACSGRPGSVNARVFAHMANHEKVREALALKGLIIPRTTLFVGGLHDTTRDEIEFFEEKQWPHNFVNQHQKNLKVFEAALALNSKERTRRFLNTSLQLSPQETNQLVKIRSVSLFEPRPELNHATNTLCIVGGRDLTKNIFLDRRAFLNSYNPSLDPEGEILTKILNAAVPVCGGINLEYYFSRVDNQKWGAGTKLPHNVMGLFGVANGIDGDLRPGLPSQMIEVHDPIRLLIVVEQSADVLLKSVQRNSATFEWIQNEWVRLASIDPATKTIHIFENGKMTEYKPKGSLSIINDISSYVQSSRDNLAVGYIKESV
jgi:uncharacterized protein